MWAGWPSSLFSVRSHWLQTRAGEPKSTRRLTHAGPASTERRPTGSVPTRAHNARSPFNPSPFVVSGLDAPEKIHFRFFRLFLLTSEQRGPHSSLL